MSLGHLGKAEFFAHFNHFGESLGHVELGIHLELAGADWAENTIWIAELEAAIASVQDTLVVYAVLEAEHMTDLVHHGRAGALHPNG